MIFPAKPDPGQPGISSCRRFSLTVAALDELDEGISIFDERLLLVGWNMRFFELLDFPMELARVGTPFADFIRFNVDRGEYGPGDPGTQFSRRMRRARESEQHCFQRTRPDGVILEVRGRKLPDGGFVTVYSDVTERKRTEDALHDGHAELEARVAARTAELKDANRRLRAEMEQRERIGDALAESENKIRLILDALPSLVAYIGADGRYEFANRRHEQWFDVPLQDIIGKPLGVLVGPALGADLGVFVDAALAGRDGYVEYAIEHADGARREVCSSFIPHREEGDRVVGLFQLCRDVTESKQAQKVLSHTQKMETVAQLTGGVAHDFNNLLTVIIGNLTFVKETLDPLDMAGKATAAAMDAAFRGADLTGRLLAFSRRQTLRPKVLNPARLAASTVDFLRRTLGPNIRIENRIDDHIWNMYADLNQLTHALLNLAINARDAMLGGGKLALRASNVRVDPEASTRHPDREPGEYVLVSVTDTGQGMPDEVLERAFEPFFTTKDVGRGTGLGLSMVYGFMKQSGGHLEIHSRVGLGTTVDLYFPRAGEGRGAEAVDMAGDVAALGGGETVLLVEDDADIRTFLTRDLGRRGYRVLEAETAKAALTILASDRTVDLLVTDLAMPGGMSGHDLIRDARILRPNLRTICMSGYPDQVEMHLNPADMSYPILRKPFEIGELLRQMHDVLAVGVPQ